MTGVELKVQSYNPLTAEEARELYALYVQRGARLTASEARAERYRGALEDAPDCGDNSCRFAVKKGGMRTNGGCRCIGRSMVNWTPVERYALRARSALADAPGGEKEA